jgi:WD40 repeat protein
LDADGLTELVDATTRKTRWFTGDPEECCPGWGEAVAFSPDGTLLAGGRFSTVNVWRVEDETALARIDQWDVRALAFSPDGTRLVTNGFAKDPRVRSRDLPGTVRVWDPRTGALIGSFEGLAQVDDVDFSPDGARLAITSSDGTLRLLDGATMRPVMTVATDADGKVAFSPDGTRLAYAAEGGVVRVLALRVDDLIELARSRLTGR